ncbi:MAG TPA: hypothetical protein DCZ75_03720 [Geobacter sp.]|nr:hypothetical protein [Geobacter sp.]
MRSGIGFPLLLTLYEEWALKSGEGLEAELDQAERGLAFSMVGSYLSTEAAEMAEARVSRMVQSPVASFAAKL